jgi:hypothetical protein
MKIPYLSPTRSMIFLAAALFTIVFSCSDDDGNSTKIPVINGFTPTSALPGASVTITGENFSATASENQVFFNNVTASVTSASKTELVAVVPATATTGKISIIVGGKTATSAADFTVLQTMITGLSPESGMVGTTVTITGTNFSTTSSDNVVKFNGTTATVSEATATQITVTVPAEATTGPVTVAINGKTATSANNFTILAPTIASYFPGIAAPGISVIITGTNFSTIATNNIVKFNGTAATVTEASATSLTVTVPNGATIGPLTVQVGPNTATSVSDFSICNGSAELVISDVVISNGSGSTSYTVSFKVTNVGSVDADLSKTAMQNYAVTDVAGSNSVAASGFGFPDAPVLTPGASYTISNYVCNIVGGNTSNHPYLMITFYDSPDGSVPECNVGNNTVIKQFNP